MDVGGEKPEPSHPIKHQYPMNKTRFARTVAVLLLLGSVLSAPLLLTNCARAGGEAPTREIVEKAMSEYWTKAATTVSPRSELTLNSVKFGNAYKATAQEVQVEGFPEGGTVTPALIEFTVRNYHSNETQAVRRTREAKVYKDKFNEWKVQTGSVRGQDSTTKEPAQK